jgi:magnesium-dependent phosphatase 1
MYLLDGAPLKATTSNTVLTSGCDEVELIGASRRILNELATQPEWQHTQVAYVSRTTEPAWAKTCLQLLKATPHMSLDEQGALQV